jgi:hypothetical protein
MAVGDFWPKVKGFAGTLLQFGLTKASARFTLDWSGITALRSIVMPNRSGTIAVGDTTSGNMLYGSGASTGWSGLGIGSTGSVLSVVAGVPAWGVSLATQTDQEAGTSTTAYVTPGRQQYHPSAAKAWVYFTVAATVVTVQRSYNVTSVTRTGTGAYTVTFTTAFSDALYAAMPVPDSLAGIGNLACNVNARSTGSCTFFVTVTTAAVIDPSGVSIAFFGDQ